MYLVAISMVIGMCRIGSVCSRVRERRQMMTIGSIDILPVMDKEISQCVLGRSFVRHAGDTRNVDAATGMGSLGLWLCSFGSPLLVSF